MKQSLRKKLTIAIAFVMLLTIGLISLLANFLIERQFTNYLGVQQERRTQEIADHIGQQYDLNTEAWNSEFVHDIGMDALADGYIIQVKNSDGQIIWDAETCDMTMCNQITADIMNRMQEKYPQLQGEFSSKQINITKNNDNVGTVNFQYYGPYFLDKEDFQFLAALNKILVGIAVFSLLFAVVIGTFLARRFSRPIQKTVSVAKRIADGDYSERIEEDSSTIELNELMISINHLAESLKKQEALRKQLTADVAHELRTPLTSVGTHIEAMLEGVWEPTNERLQSCYDEILRLGKIISDLESLARVESENLKLNKASINLKEMAGKVLVSFEAEIIKKNLVTSITGTESLINADPDRMSQVFNNLISNAVKYTPNDGSIEILISEEKSSEEASLFEIKVKNSGIGIPAEELPYIFERFYRADKSRNRMTGGSGIGLAVVKSIVTAHGGRVQAESRPDDGTCITVSLPSQTVQNE